VKLSARFAVRVSNAVDTTPTIAVAASGARRKLDPLLQLVDVDVVDAQRRDLLLLDIIHNRTRSVVIRSSVGLAGRVTGAVIAMATIAVAARGARRKLDPLLQLVDVDVVDAQRGDLSIVHVAHNITWLE